MISQETILACIEGPMEHYHQKMKSTIGDWKPLIGVSEKLLAGTEVENDECPASLLPLLNLMKLIMQITKESEWDWTNPAIQEAFKELAESHLYKMFAEAAVGVISAIIRTVEIGTLIEVGTGPGQVTERLCEEMIQQNLAVPIIMAKKYLEKHFSFIHTCDSKTIEAINLPVTDFTLAIK